ncbi:Trehalose synthase complex regulatory subunit TPS3 [Candida viswanathii]|uniref:Trehalose synthase complex regulatory subunit TPS3 n=1 Tax=Candida viswanathii TaxID=5486 RepID=A0A367YLP9_9ASCO|nr:Trehalose synthase complex regulatory subunit TPS3 [Candida viswanathii]
MTVIIASLFLPYNVHFQADSSDLDSCQQDATSFEIPQSTSTPSTTASSTQLSILPSLSKQPTPQPRSTTTSALSDNKPFERSDTPEGFFYNRRSSAKSEHQFIQPKSRYIKMGSSIVDGKKPNEDMGLPGFSRSQVNLAANSTPNLSHAPTPLPPPPNNRLGGGGGVGGRSSFSKALFTFHGNSSANSLLSEDGTMDSTVILPSSLEDDEFDHNFNDMVHGRSRLAPFGGFSRPGVEAQFLSQKNIFDVAPWTIDHTEHGNGSLTKAVNMAVESGIMDEAKWVGIVAMPSDDVSLRVKSEISDKLSKEYDCEAVFPDDVTFEGHYKSFCKQILWPTMHYQIPDDPKSKAFEDHSWGHYVLMNELIADKIVETYEKLNDEETKVWIHDYHLLLVPKMVREKLPTAKIGFFLHVSFPSSEVFRCFAQRNQLLEGMLGANCIGFQTNEYVRHFLQTCNRLLLADTSELGVTYNGNFTVTATIPVGIDAESVLETVHSTLVKEWRALIKERWSNQYLIVSRDKLDKLRGIKQKLLAYEMFLTNNPEYIEKTVLIQICIGSATDPDYELEVMKIVSRINSLPENISVTQPVVLLQRDIDFDQYLALQCEADVFVVSSMREGLNLTCHEFITASEDKKSPLMLSEFTGSSNLLLCKGEGALLINPWDIKKFSETFKELLTMSPEEKKMRWKNCYNIVLTRDSKHWVECCLDTIESSWDVDHAKSCNLIPFKKEVFKTFANVNGKKIIILALEISSSTSSTRGSTTGLVSGKVNVVEPTRLVRLLSDLVERPDTYVYLLSYLQRPDLDIMFKRFPRIGLMAENGSFVKLIGAKDWISLTDKEELNTWMPEIIKLIDSKVERLPGSFCEVQDATIRFHAGKSFVEDRERSLDAMGETIQHINTLYDGEGIHATSVRNLVIVQKNQINLKAIRLILSCYDSNQDENYVVSHISDYQQPIKDDAVLPGDHQVAAVLYSGGLTSIDESNYEYVNCLKDDIGLTLTVTLISSSSETKTAARYGVRGINELLCILND